MLVLAVDAATPATGVALHDGARVLVERVHVDPRRHGEVLAVLVRDALAAAGCAARDLTAVVAGIGPGPYTGLRVGVVTAAALAQALDIPAYGVCSLDALGTGERVAVVDARRREVFWARYDAAGARVEGPAVDRPADLALTLRPGDRVVGAGGALHPEALGAWCDPDGPQHPSPGRLAALGALLAAQGAPTGPLRPIYLRRPDAAAPHPPKRVSA